MRRGRLRNDVYIDFFLTYVLHLLLKLNWVCTAVVLVFFLLCSIFTESKAKDFRKRESAFWMYRCILTPCCIRFEGAEDNPCI